MKIKRALAAALSTVMLGSVIPATAFTASAEPTTTVLYSTSFENGECDFTARDGASTVASVTTDAATGSSCLESSGRTSGWHGPQFLLDSYIEQGTEYMVSAKVKTPWYGTIMLSTDYTDESGERHYGNLKTVVSEGGWVDVTDVKFSFPEGATKMYVYFECSDANVNIYVDDFVLETTPVYDIQQDIASLKDVYSPYFKFGTAVTASELAPVSAQNLIKKHFNSLTPGNELKPESILDKNACFEMAAAGDDTNPQVNIASARSILNFCRDNNISVRGHVLVWHSQTPDWFFKENYDESADWVSKEEMLVRMENYIKNVFAALEKEYPTVDFYAWDVVNECFLDNGSARTGGTQAENANYSGWVKVFGDNSFIKPAFEYARKYAPEGCKLYYNDFNEYMPGKTSTIVAMANELKAENLIDGIGMQSHLDVGFPTASAYKKALAAFAETGLDVQVTELDITTSDTSEAGFETQAKLYSEIMDACVEYADSISSVVVWGTTDDKSWRASRCPLLFNEDFTAKPAYYSIVDGLEVPDPTDPPETEPTEPSTEPVIDFTPGDVNYDGAINSMDSVTLRRQILNRKDLSYSEALLPVISPSDTDGNGYIEVADLVLLNQFLVGEDVEFKVYTGK